MIWVTSDPLGPDTMVPFILDATILDTLTVDIVMVEAITDDTLLIELFIADA